MAGDWIKMECSTPDKPEVLAITARMGWEDSDLTVGKLFKLWRWFDQHTTNGNAAGVTSALLDKQIGVTGFVTAVSSVGWLSINESGISLVSFEKHNGTTAKTRAQTAKRVSSFKSNAKANAESNGDSVTNALPREEKRREDIDTQAFDQFWSVYPKKVAKPAAIKAFKSAKINGHLPEVLADIESKKHSPDWQKNDGQFVPNPATYLNQRRWEDGKSEQPSGILAGAI